MRSNTSETIHISYQNKMILQNEGKRALLGENPALKGTTPSFNQILTYVLNDFHGDNYDKYFDKYSDRNNNHTE